MFLWELISVVKIAIVIKETATWKWDYLPLSEMGDNVLFPCEENYVEDWIEYDIDENYVEFNCGKFYVGGNKNNELSKKPYKIVSEEEDLITFKNENYS